MNSPPPTLPARTPSPDLEQLVFQHKTGVHSATFMDMTAARENRWQSCGPWHSQTLAGGARRWRVSVTYPEVVCLAFMFFLVFLCVLLFNFIFHTSYLFFILNVFFILFFQSFIINVTVVLIITNIMVPRCYISSNKYQTEHKMGPQTRYYNHMHACTYTNINNLCTRTTEQ